ncbi:MAG TPA: hypothetical protein VN541_20065 [Tepidisphaeraceae bacterium]|nr:hypothetical protein [Tepidisphaeraceae bacterium]
MSPRPTISFFLAFAAIASVSATPQQSNKAPDSRDQEIAMLRQLYADEISRNETLRQEIQRLNAKLTGLQARSVAEQQRLPGTERVPENWKPFGFNGMRVYLVPLGAEQALKTK